MQLERLENSAEVVEEEGVVGEVDTVLGKVHHVGVDMVVVDHMDISMGVVMMDLGEVAVVAGEAGEGGGEEDDRMGK